MKRITRPVAAVALALSLSMLAGCSDDWKAACEKAGGTVETDKEKCGTKTQTTGSGTSKKTKTVNKYKTERECIKDGKEVTPEDDGFCS